MRDWASEIAGGAARALFGAHCSMTESRVIMASQTVFLVTESESEVLWGRLFRLCRNYRGGCSEQVEG